MKLVISFISVLLISIGNLLAQSISGRIVDKDNNSPIRFAEIIVYDHNTAFASELTNDDGNFLLNIKRKGNFLIRITQYGSTLYEKSVDLSDINVNLGVISVDNSIILEGVTVTATKKLIEKRLDRLVYHVQNSAFANGLGGDELLKNIPRIDPTSDGLKIIGKSNVLVMVDDRLLNISGDDLKNYLKSLRSENIAKIEIITSPSAKYDAAGNSGLINIKLKKNNNIGFDGNLSAAYQQRTKSSTTNFLNLNYSKEKLIMNYNIVYDNSTRCYDYTNNYFFTNETRKSFENTENSNTGLSHNFNADYKILKGTNVGFYFNYGDWDNNSNRDSKARFYNLNDEVYKSQNLPTNTRGSFSSISFSPYLDIALDTTGSKLKFFYNCYKNNRRTNVTFKSENYTGNFQTIENISQSKNNTDYNFNVNAINVDLETTLFNTNVTLGAKYTCFKNDNDLRYFDCNNENDVLNTAQSNFFKYTERLFASYLSLSKNFNNQFNLTAGIRYEYTNTNGRLVTQDSTNMRSYGNFFPNISLSYEPNDDYAYSLSYNRRISRPGLYDLNPFKIYKDANNYEVGNPYLLPNITDNIEFGFVYKGNLSSTLYASKISDNWAYIVNSDNNHNIIITQPQNVLTTYEIGSEIAYNWRINDRINNFSSVNLSYQKSTSSDFHLSDADLRGFRCTLSSNTTIALNKDKTNKLFVNMFYNTPGIEEMYISQSTFFLRVGVLLNLISKKLDLNASITDPFNTTIARNKVHFSNFQFAGRIFNDNRNFNISLVYKFGKNKSKTHNREIDNSDNNRAIKDK